ncbi:MAG: XdhC family protein [Armatimonadetes bacterium]|nr:XdhC family protein [Armatimonadota bacterium]
MCQGESSLLEPGLADVYFEHLPPGPRLVIIGAGNDALPLERMAREVGWMTCVSDYRADFAVSSRFPAADQLATASLDDLPGLLSLDSQTFVVLMTHGYLADRTLLPALLASDCPYVGMVSSRQRSVRLLDDLKMDRPAKFHAPVGLNLGAEGPEEIALSILAEMQGVLSQCAASR